MLVLTWTILQPAGNREYRGWCCRSLVRAAKLRLLRYGVTSDQVAHLVAQEADTYYHGRFHRIDYRFLRDAEQISPPGNGNAVVSVSTSPVSCCSILPSVALF